MPIKIRAVAEGDRAEWEKLYQGYAEFYRTEQSADMRARVWEWLFDPGHEVEGLVAEDADGRLVGYGGGLERKAWLLRHEGVLVA